MGDESVIESDDVRRIVERAVRRAVAGALTVDAAVNEALGAVAERRAASTPAERMADEAALYLAEFDRLGGGRDAASAVARRFSDDADARERIAQRVRALVRRRKTKPLRFTG